MLTQLLHIQALCTCHLMVVWGHAPAWRLPPTACELPAARPPWVCFPDTLAVPGVCVRWSSWFSAQPENKTWARVVREECSAQSSAAGVPGGGSAILPCRRELLCLFPQMVRLEFKVLDF